MYQNLKLIINLVEWETSNGTFVALTSKSYQCYDVDKNEIKKSTKGIPHSFKFSMDTFQRVLLDEEMPRQTVEINSLRRNLQKEMTRQKMEKTCLSDIFVKMQTSSDKISCTPLTVNGEYL